MDGKLLDSVDELQLTETPEDVAVLFSWANLKGAKYRDFSASRREYRAQVRHRAAEAQRESELRAKAEAEISADGAERAALEAEEAARFHGAEARRASDERRRYESEMQENARDHAMQHAAELSQRAASERVEAVRRAEAVVAAEAAARREARELVEAHASAQRQAARYAESDQLRQRLAGPQPASYLPGIISDPYENDQPVEIPGRAFHRPTVADEDLKPTRIPRSRDPFSIVPDAARRYSASGRWTNDQRSEYRGDDLPAINPLLDSDMGARPGASYSYEPNSEERVAAVDQYAHFAPYADSLPSGRENRYAQAAAEARRSEEQTRRPRGFQPDEASGFFNTSAADESSGQNTPAWLHSQEVGYGAESRSRLPSMSVGSAASLDTLQESRERVASRWYALKGVLDDEDLDVAPASVPQQVAGMAPLLTIFSLAGGVGKTSLVATLGRALSAHSEAALLVDTTSHGLLPFYFGASELKAGVVRRFSPPPGSSDAPIALIGFDLSGREGEGTANWLGEELNRASRGMQRVLVDLSPASGWLMRRLARMNTLVIVPLAPDMNSVISLGSVEKFFAGIIDGEGRPVRPYFLLNNYDPSLPLHLDVREVMRQQLGDRLLPFVIRRSPSVSEALAEGMTVVDYASDAPIANDYLSLASWLQAQSAPATPGTGKSRWSER